MGHPPVLTSFNPLSTHLQRFACAGLSRPCLPGSSARRFRNAHYHGLQLAVAWDQHLIAEYEGPPSSLIQFRKAVRIGFYSIAVETVVTGRPRTGKPYEN